MRFSEAWLREWVNPKISRQQLLQQLTMAGLEVDSYETLGHTTEGLIIVKILAVNPHPNADRLQICTVLLQENQTLNIVCGASNVAVGKKAVLAQTGTRLGPKKILIKPSTIRGISSAGMLVSLEELGLTTKTDTNSNNTGILILPENAPVGESFVEYAKLNDTIIEIDLTPNRGDCLSLIGLAREVSALNSLPFAYPHYQAVATTHQQQKTVEVDDPKSCPVYLGCVIKDNDLSAQTPFWMQEKLRRSAIRPISPIVDVTNYVLLELGQPLHAFDLQKLQGNIRVRWAQEAETLVLLDDKNINLKANTLVIADDRGPIALAGIMGGLDTSVCPKTQDIFLECAFFTPTAIAGRARQYGLHTDTSHRFERGVDPELQSRALARALELLCEITKGQAGPIIECKQQKYKPNQVSIELKWTTIEDVLGLKIEPEFIKQKLTLLGNEITEHADGLHVIPPSHRFDLALENDLIEEIARLYGYDRLPSQLPLLQATAPKLPENKLTNSYIKRVMANLGYQEAITYSFIDQDSQTWLSPQMKTLTLKNPISKELSVMRSSLWPGLLKCCLYNKYHQRDKIKLFEIGQVFYFEERELKQSERLSGVRHGWASRESWCQEDRTVDFFDLKGDIEELLEQCGQNCSTTANNINFVAGQHPALHPGQSAQIRKNDIFLGWMGALHPSILKKLGLSGKTFVFELTLDGVRQSNVPVFKGLSRFPEVRRDIAIVLDHTITSDQVAKEAKEIIGDLLKTVTVFDVYKGSGIAKGGKSLALGIRLQSASKTLKEADVNQLMEALVQRLKSRFNAVLRE